MAILESVRKLAEKLGAETNGRDITDQLNIINRHLDSTGSRDIAEAVSKFADTAGGDTSYNRIITKIPISGTESNIVGIVNPSDSNGTFNVVASTSGQIYNVSNFTLTSAATKVNVSGAPGMRIVFTPSENFDGFYDTYGDTKLTMDGDTVTNGDGKAYVANVSLMSNKVTITKGGDFVYIVE